MAEKLELYIKKRKRQRMLKKLKRYGIIAAAVLIPAIVLAVIHHLKKKAKKKVREAVRTKVREHAENRSASKDSDDE